MSLIQGGANRGPRELTKEEKQEFTKTQIEKDAYEAFSTLTKTYEKIYKRVWENHLGLTPQEVFDSLGPQGAELFQLSALLVQTVNTAQPGAIQPAQPYEFTINPDGTVTIGAAK